MGCISDFMESNYRHFNARETLAAAKAWRELIDRGGTMFLAMGGAMSTAEIGVSLAEMIRRDKISAICCTAANLEEDVFNLLDHDAYRLEPGYRDLSPAEEKALYAAGFNRVTDTCIPEGVFRQAQARMVALWREAAENGRPRFPWEFMYALLDQPGVEELFEIPREHSWVLAAKEKGLPIYTPGWEDCTLGNILVSEVMRGDLPHHGAVRRGTEQLEHLARWYSDMADRKIPVGFFQIGGGISGDFPICVAPMLIQDLERTDIPFWAFFAQVSDSTTSYGSYSGAAPNEKITWGKLDPDTPRFMIESDASIVAPLIFSYVLGR